MSMWFEGEGLYVTHLFEHHLIQGLYGLTRSILIVLHFFLHHLSDSVYF